MIYVSQRENRAIFVILLHEMCVYVRMRVSILYSRFDSNSNKRLYVLTCFIQTYSLFMSSNLLENRG